jgi:transcriptional regulator with XRE-family HTH domain
MAKQYEQKTLLHNLLDRQMMTQKYFAELMGVDGPTVSMWLYGKRMPNPDFVTKMASILQIDRDYLQGFLIAINVIRNNSSVVANHVADHIKTDIETKLLREFEKGL